jgi:hypothetical protein
MKTTTLGLFSALWVFLALGCDSSTGPQTGAGGLPEGHYFIQSDSDDLYRYQQYFVVLSDGRWEFIEYGVAPATSQVCQITRQAGTYGVADSVMALTLRRGGPSLEKCPITQADFNGYRFSGTSPQTQAFPVRNINANSFEADNLFVGVSGWRRYALVSDPHGFYD